MITNFYVSRRNGTIRVRFRPADVGSGDCCQIKGIVVDSDIAKYHLLREFKWFIEDGSTLFFVEFREVSSTGTEKVTGRTCRRISSSTCRRLESFCLGGCNFWTT